MILYDQRGAGKSTPTCELRENTTQHLVSDIEALRKHHGIEKWHLIFGGSWGSTLSLLYAQAHPDRVSNLVLRGIFLARESELAWDTTGACQLFPEAYAKYLEPLPVEDRCDPVRGHYKLLMSDDREAQMRSVRALDAWVSTHVALPKEVSTPPSEVKAEDEDWLLSFCKLNMYYIYHRCFIEEGQILRGENMDRIKHIPCTIVQGRYDIFCPPVSAWELHKAWPGSKLIMIENAGHSSSVSRGCLVSHSSVKLTNSRSQVSSKHSLKLATTMQLQGLVEKITRKDCELHRS